MIDDFKPAPARPAKSLTEALGDRQAEPGFQTPEQVAAADDLTEEPAMPNPPAEQNPKNSWRDKLAVLKLHWPPGKKEWLVLGVVLVLIGGGVTAWLTLHHPLKPVPHKLVIVKPKLPPKPTTVPSNLTGLPVDPSVNQRPVTGVMIENSLDARPQSGLGQAGVVFEAMAEGGVTRFLALFQDTAPDNIGPIRSARPYYIQWDLGFDAPYAHVGGSPDALSDINSWGVKDMNQFANGGYYHRVSTRAAPHNVYTAISTLNQLEAKKGYGASQFTSLPRKAEAPSKAPTARSIGLHLSGPIYDPHFDYNAATNSYLRSENGTPHVDANTNLQISPKVVIAMVIPEGRGALDSSGAYYSNYQVIGSGTAYVFQDGIVTTGQWTKSGNTAQISFTDANGNPLQLNAGQTWLTAVTSTGAVSYTQ